MSKEVHFRTGDLVTDKNLTLLRHQSNWRDRSTEEQIQELALCIIRVEKMLPAAVRKHFKTPSPYIGDGAYTWTTDYRTDWANQMCDAITESLASIYNDTSLQCENKPDLSDRPKSCGEAIIEALDRYEETRSASDLSAIGRAVSPTSLTYYFKQLESAHSQQRDRGNQSPEVAQQSAIYRLRAQAENWFHVTA